MQYILKVHLFQTIEEANASIDLINKGEGIPINDEAVTRTYTQTQENEGRIFILADEITQKYLGDAIDLEIIYNEEV
jgi:hypothetical protein